MKEKKPIDGKTWQANINQAIDLINSSSSFLFSGDIDPDSVGSMLSLSLYLNQLGKEVFIIIPEPLKGNLDFFEKIISWSRKIASKQFQRDSDSLKVCVWRFEKYLFYLYEMLFEDHLRAQVRGSSVQYCHETDSFLAPYQS